MRLVGVGYKAAMQGETECPKMPNTKWKSQVKPNPSGATAKLTSDYFMLTVSLSGFLVSVSYRFRNYPETEP